MKFLVFSDSDYNFSAKLATICDLGSDKLFFLNDFNSLYKFKDKDNLLLIIDFDDYSKNLELVINSIKKIGNFSTCILINKIDSKFHKKATSIGFDIVMSKKMFLMNIKTIKTQIRNNVKNIQ